MLPENDKINIRHCLAISIKFGGVDFKRQWANTKKITRQIQQRLGDQSIGFSISYFLFALLLNSKLLNFNVALNHFSKQSAANSNSTVKISEIAMLLFVA